MMTPEERRLRISQKTPLEAIEFAINAPNDSGLDFLREWTFGAWETIDREWPEFLIGHCA